MVTRRDGERDNGAKGFQELLQRTHGQNQGVGMEARKGGGFGWQWGGGVGVDADNCN